MEHVLHFGNLHGVNDGKGVQSHCGDLCNYGGNSVQAVILRLSGSSPNFRG